MLRNGAMALAALALWPAMALAQRPGAITNLDISGAPSGLAAGVPVIAVDPQNSKHIALIWRFIAPQAAPGGSASGDWGCHLSFSSDGGATFKDQALIWDAGSRARCNAPYVSFSGHGTLYLGATLTGPRPPAAPSAPPGHPDGEVAFARSDDGGRSIGKTSAPIASGMLDSFDVGPEIPATAKSVPWDGARGVADPSSGAIYLTGAYPAPPAGAEMSQRFFTVSTDGGANFGRIRSFGDAAWPERWDGDIAAAHGEFAISYIGAATPDTNITCPCAVFGVSHDGGKNFSRSLVAPAADLDTDTVVHYPEIAADPAHGGAFAVAVIGAKQQTVSAYLTKDDGASWKKLSAALPSDVVNVSRPAVAFSPQGILILAWRGYHADGGYDIYAAAAGAGRMGATVRISTATSHLPAALEKTYALRGDFHTSLAADDKKAHLAWADARSSADVRVYYAQVPLSALPVH